ncbi:S1 family peptidase [Metabacillus idriensis]|uniref:S1 family peptidase n=1 Tax=Metabacillus idriensis TaxID=324768 RepID=UPI001CD5E657|nr:serine protease [Metabacillus idriensis]
MDTLDQLAKSTVKIECDNNTTGTGFFFNFFTDDQKKTHVPTIITNRHVLEGINNIKLIISLNDYFTSSDRSVTINTVSFNDIQKSVVYHSDPTVDLCALVITPIIDSQIPNKVNFAIKSLSMDNIPLNEELENLRFVEELLMVGYPNGISDQKNNFPIFRKGTTASHPGVDFNGNPECVVDMTVTPGSSGSPVFIYDSNGYREKNGNLNLYNERLIFLGINKAVFVASNIGEIVELPSPTKFVSHSNIGINLGIIVKAKAIKDLEFQIFEKLQEQVSSNIS